MRRSKPDGVSGLKGKVERNSIPNPEAIFKCQLLAEEKKSIFFHWNFTEHTNLTYAHNGQNNVNSVVFLETFFSSLFELFFFFPYCFFAYVLRFLILCFYQLVCVYLHMLVYVS